MSYRDSTAALQEQKTTLESKVDILRSKLKEHSELEAELLKAITLLEDVYAQLASAKAVKSPELRSLPILSNLKIASPCNVPWESMQGNEQVRHCLSCDKNVYNLSSMTSAEAETLLQEHEGKVCVMYFRRTDGTIITTDCPVGVAKKKKIKRNTLIAAGAIAATTATAFTAYNLESTEESPIELTTQVKESDSQQRPPCMGTPHAHEMSTDISVPNVPLANGHYIFEK